MTRARRQIEQAAQAKGYAVVEATWSPLGAMVEMQGPEGGWVVVLDAPDGRREYIPAPTLAWVLDEIEYLPDAREPEQEASGG